MKKAYLLIFLLIGIVFFSGCGKEEVSYEKHLISFSYSYGSINEGISDYSITLNGESVIYLLSTSDDYIEKELDSSILKDINNIINKYDVSEWDGYNKHDDIEDNDEISFSIQLGFDDGSNYNASGYGNYPKNFDKVHKELINYLNKINN